MDAGKLFYSYVLYLMYLRRDLSDECADDMYQSSLHISEFLDTGTSATVLHLILRFASIFSLF